MSQRDAIAHQYLSSRIPPRRCPSERWKAGSVLPSGIRATRSAGDGERGGLVGVNVLMTNREGLPRLDRRIDNVFYLYVPTLNVLGSAVYATSSH